MNFVRGLKIVVVALLACVLLGLVVEHLWNWLMPGIFGLSAISFLQAVGLLLLSKLLFGGIHRHVGRGRGRREWKRGMEQRFAHMTPEEREKFRAGMRSRWGCRPRPIDDVPARTEV